MQYWKSLREFIAVIVHRGMQIAQGLIEDNPGRVFVFCIHSSDNYSKPQNQSHPDFRTQWGVSLQQLSGLRGFPGGMVNRQMFNGSQYQQQATGVLCLSRGGWSAAVGDILNDPVNSPVNIGAKTTWDAATRTLEVDVELYYTADAGQNNKLNIAFLESGVIGYQSGGSANYTHKHILRDFLTGQWGEELTETTEGTLFTKKYTYNVTEDWVIDNCDLVLFVTQADNKYIYTGIEIPAITPNLVLTSEGDLFSAVNSGNDFEKEIEITNTTNTDFSITASVEKSDRTPDDWTASISGETNLTIPAGEKTNVSFSLSVGSTIGIGDATLIITETGVENPLSYHTQISAISAEATKFEINDDNSETNTFDQTFKATGRNNIIPLVFSDFSKVSDQISNLDLLVWNAGREGGIDATEATFIDNQIKNGTNVLINGQVAIPMLTFDNRNHPLFYSLGISWTQGSDIQLSSYNLAGVDGDPVTNGFEANNISNSTQRYWLQPLDLINESIATPIINCVQQNKPVAVRVENSYSRSIVTFNMDVITDATLKEDLIDRCLNWLEGTTDVDDNTLENNGLSLNVYPNIVESSAKVVFNTNDGSNIKLSVYNQLGQEVMILKNGSESEIDNFIELNTSELSSGLYHVVLSNGISRISTPVIITK
jgi:hypothetical protein